MQTKELFAAGERLISSARKFGATGVSCGLSVSQDSGVSVRDGVIDDVTLSSDRSLVASVLVGTREGSVSSDSFLPEDLDRIAEEAVAMAKQSGENKHLRLARPDEWPCDPKKIPARLKELDLYDGAKLLSLSELEKRALKLERIAGAFPGVARTSSGSMGHWRGVSVSMTSEGFRAAIKRSQYGKSISVIAEREKEMNSGGDSHSAIYLDDLRLDEECARRAGERAVSQLGARPIPTALMPVVFDAQVSASLLRALVSAIGAERVHRKSTFLLKKLGEAVFSPGISVIDEPHLPRRFGSRLFDAECVGMIPRTIVESGIIKMWLADIESGAKIGIASTGHASDTANLSMLPGVLSKDELLREVGNGFLVTELLGHGANITTGAYSMGAAGLLIQNGALTIPVNKVTVAGNLLDMFRELRPASDMSENGRTNAPTCFVGTMTVSGK